MNIIIVTGAAGGIGKEFIRQLKNEKGIDEIWAIGRTEKKLQALREEFGDKVVPVPLDITNDDELIAVLTAAVAASLNTSTYHLNIKSYRRIENTSPAWNKAGLRDVIDARF